MRLEEKWNMVRIDVQTEIDKEILSESRLGEKLKSLRDEGPIPNPVLIKFLGTLLDSRLATNHGWVVYNFPQQNRKHDQEFNFWQKLMKLFLILSGFQNAV